MDILNIVKALLKITDDAQDTILTLYVSMVEQSILNYCNIKEVPEALNYVWANMVVDMHRENLLLPDVNAPGEDAPDEIAESKIASISEAGRTVSFDTKESKAKQNVEKLTALQEIIGERVSKITELNRYKKLYRVGD
jgi:hypothetical protein